MPEEVRCRECQRLWAEYLSALLEQVRLDRQLYFASQSREPDQLQLLKNALQAAGIATKSLRERIERHRDAHPGADRVTA